jgi:hypothetical protein
MEVDTAIDFKQCSYVEPVILFECHTVIPASFLALSIFRKLITVPPEDTTE